MPLCTLLLVGCGKMGLALAKGWIETGRFAITIIDPHAQPEDLPTSALARLYPSLDKAPADLQPEAVVLAIKPQQMAEVLPAYAKFRDSVFLSIAAGQTLARLGSLLSEAHALVRAMPNLPASIGLGATALYANASADEDHRRLCEDLMRAVGQTVWLAKEEEMNAVTALSGSGPAYIFALIEAMTKAGCSLGLSEELAAQLAQQTLTGSAALLAQSGQTPAALRQAVTSPGGTTAAALVHLLDANKGLDPLLKVALEAANRRATELAQ